MCEIVTSEGRPGVFEIICKKSGKYITISNENGMYCEDMCDEDKDIEAGKKLDELLKAFDKFSKETM